MQIVASRIALQGQHSALVEQRRSETLRIERTGAAPLVKVARAEPASADQSGEQLAIEQDVLLIKLLVEALSGRKINIARFDSAAPQASAAPHHRQPRSSASNTVSRSFTAKPNPPASRQPVP